jgi:hypothetical protein
MTNAKNALKGEAGSIVLMAAAEIRASIKKVGDLGAEFASTLHMTAVQTLLHAEKHGDATLALELVLSVKDNVPGYVWQGLVAWFRKYSPIHFYVDEQGQHAVRLLKEGEKGYKPFNSSEADENPAGEQREVKKITDREIEPMSIALIKKRIASLIKQAEKASEEGGRGFVGETPEQQEQARKTTLVFIKRLSIIADTLTVEPEVVADNKPKQEAAAA